MHWSKGKDASRQSHCIKIQKQHRSWHILLRVDFSTVNDHLNGNSYRGEVTDPFWVPMWLRLAALAKAKPQAKSWMGGEGQRSTSISKMEGNNSRKQTNPAPPCASPSDLLSLVPMWPYDMLLTVKPNSSLDIVSPALIGRPCNPVRGRNTS